MASEDSQSAWSAGSERQLTSLLEHAAGDRRVGYVGPDFADARSRIQDDAVSGDTVDAVRLQSAHPQLGLDARLRIRVLNGDQVLWRLGRRSGRPQGTRRKAVGRRAVGCLVQR